MMTIKVLFFTAVLVPFLNPVFGREKAFSPTTTSGIDSIYIELGAGRSPLPDLAVFQKAMQSVNSLPDGTEVVPDIISIIDFTKPSTEKRLWVIDLRNGKVLHHTLVAHGKNSGDLYARKFSNIPESKQSSLGLYITGTTYIGKHGLSLKLHGLEPGVNDRAEQRAIVIHAADYVSESYVKKTGRLGRSFGCPAIPVENHQEIIRKLANGSCLYIHYASS